MHTVIAHVLDAHIERANDMNDVDETNKATDLCFRSAEVPDISVKAYLARIVKYLPNTTDDCLLVALMYVQRMTTSRSRSISLNRWTVHRLLLASILIATKYMEDEHMNNETFAIVGGISLSELNGLERVFLTHIDYNCGVAPSEHAAIWELLCQIGNHELETLMSMCRALPSWIFVNETTANK